jgi:uncharacterized membrane protein YciS (DUF1049 family)
MKIAKIIISTIFIVAIVTFATSNRDIITLSLWPFSYELSLSISTSIILFIFIGFILGGFSSWLFGSKTRRLLRAEKKVTKNSNKEIKNKEQEINNLNDQIKLLEEQIKLLKNQKNNQ